MKDNLSIIRVEISLGKSLLKHTKDRSLRYCNVKRSMCETMQRERINARRCELRSLFSKVHVIRRDRSETRINQRNVEG